MPTTQTTDMKAAISEFIENELVEKTQREIQRRKKSQQPPVLDNTTTSDIPQKSQKDASSDTTDSAFYNDPYIRALRDDILSVFMSTLTLTEDDINLEANAIEYGVDSISATEIMQKTSQLLNVTVPPTILFEADSIDEMIRLLSKRYKQEMLDHYGPKIAQKTDSISDTARVEPVDKDPASGPETPFILSDDVKAWIDENRSILTFDNQNDLIYPLTYEQKRYWNMEQLDTVNAGLIMPFAFNIKGLFNESQFLEYFKRILDRHDTLNYGCRIVDYEPKLFRQHVSDIPVMRHDVSSLKKDTQEDQILMIIEKDLGIRFDLLNGPLFRISIIKCSDVKTVLLINVHHLIFDANSIYLFANELFLYYRYSDNDVSTHLPDNSVQYSDYIQWEQSFFTKEVIQKNRRFWLSKLEGNAYHLNLPYKTSGKLAPTTIRKTAVMSQELDRSYVTSVAQFAQSEKITAYSIFLGTASILLYGLTENDTIVLGTPVSFRLLKKSGTMLGLASHLNLVPIECRPDNSFRAHLHDVNTQVKNRDANFLPYQELMDVLQKARIDRQERPLQVVLNYFPMTNVLFDSKSNDIEFEFRDVIRNGLGFDFFILIFSFEDRMTIRFEYDSTLFHPETVEKIMHQYTSILDILLSKATLRLDDLFSTQHLDFKKKRRLVIASTFTSEPLSEPLAFWTHRLNISCKIDFAGFNQVFQELHDPTSRSNSNNNGLNVVLIRLEDWLLDKKITTQNLKAVANTAEEYVSALKQTALLNTTSFLIYICPNSPSLAKKKKWTALHTSIEEHFAQSLKHIPKVTFINGASLLTEYRVREYYDANLDSLGQIPYTSSFFTALSTSIIRSFYMRMRPSPKVFILDCDNTLWKGVVGEVGSAGITVDAPRKRLQKLLLDQQRAGRLLCLSSKNDEEDVINVLKTHPDMLLKPEHIVSYKVNWDAKSANILALSNDLNLGLDSFVFIDDNPVEIEDVRAHCPGITTLTFPQTAHDIYRFLKHTWLFDRHHVNTKEDRKRTEYYRQDIQRTKLLDHSDSFQRFLDDLNLSVTIKKVGSNEIARAAQLTQRTNQFNSTTIRRTENDIKHYVKSAAHHCLITSVKDRFGDYGQVGLVICTPVKSELIVDSFLLSCRVLGRGVEYQIVNELASIAKAHHCKHIVFHFSSSAKNKPIEMFLTQIGRQRPSDHSPEAYSITQASAMTLKYEVKKKKNTKQTLASHSTFDTDYVNPSHLDTLWTLNTVAKITQRMNEYYSKPLTSGTKHLKRTEKKQQSSIEKTVIRLIKDIKNISYVHPNDDLINLGIDSLAMVQLIARIRQECKIMLSQDHLVSSATVGDLIRTVERMKEK